MSLLKAITRFVFTHAPRSGSAAVSEAHIKGPYLTDSDTVDGFRLLTVRKENSSNGHFYFMHGGGYTLEPIGAHRTIMLRLVNLGYKVTYIDYPLCPEYTAEKTNSVSLAGYIKLTEKYPDDTFYFIGDSSGGGLAVSLLMQLRDAGFEKRPAKTVLLSPWLDVTEENEQIPEYEKRDSSLSAVLLKTTGEKYAGSLGPEHPFVSPLYGHLDNLGSLLLFFSETEIMYPDCMKFIDLANTAKGTQTSSFVEKKASHDYLMYAKKDKLDAYYSAIQSFIQN